MRIQRINMLYAMVRKKGQGLCCIYPGEEISNILLRDFVNVISGNA